MSKFFQVMGKRKLRLENPFLVLISFLICADFASPRTRSPSGVQKILLYLSRNEQL